MKNKNSKWIDIIFWSIIIINSVIELSKGIENLNLDAVNFSIDMGIKELLYISCNSIAIFLLMMTILMIFSLLKVFPLTIIYIGAKLASKHHYKEKLDKNNFKSYGYYREVLSKYSPGELSYIDDFKLDEKDIVATIMSLELKKKIKISETIEIIDSNDTCLNSSEKYILKNIKNKSLKDIDMMTFKECVVNNCIEDNLLEERKDIRKKIIIKICIAVFVFIINIVSFLFGPYLLNTIAKDNSIILILGMIIMVALFFVMVIFPYTTFTYIMSYIKLNELEPYIRNKKAKEIKFKLEGLRKYIKEFSLLDKKDYQDLILWEDYLIYAVILDQNKKVVEEIMEKYY